MHTPQHATHARPSEHRDAHTVPASEVHTPCERRAVLAPCERVPCWRRANVRHARAVRARAVLAPCTQDAVHVQCKRTPYACRARAVQRRVVRAPRRHVQLSVPGQPHLTRAQHIVTTHESASLEASGSLGRNQCRCAIRGTAPESRGGRCLRHAATRRVSAASCKSSCKCTCLASAVQRCVRREQRQRQRLRQQRQRQRQQQQRLQRFSDGDINRNCNCTSSNCNALATATVHSAQQQRK